MIKKLHWDRSVTKTFKKHTINHRKSLGAFVVLVLKGRGAKQFHFDTKRDVKKALETLISSGQKPHAIQVYQKIPYKTKRQVVFDGE